MLRVAVCLVQGLRKEETGSGAAATGGGDASQPPPLRKEDAMRSPIALSSILVGSLILNTSSVLAKTRPEAAIRSLGTCHVVALFAQFPNEEPQQTSPPDYAQHLFDPDRPGSFTVMKTCHRPS